MKLKILLTLVMTGLMLNIGCTSSNDGESDAIDAESSDPALESEGADAAADMDQTDGEEISSEEDLAEDEVVADGDTENLPEESLEEGAASAESEEIAAEGQELADGSITNDATTAEPTNDEDSSFTSETPQETSSSDVATTTDTESSESFIPKPVVSLKKIKDVPFTEAGILLNTVYLARQGDTWKSVSTKIYGTEDKSKELRSVNPFLGSRALKVGDKVYYNSPKRAQDGERMLTYYEDNGIPAQTYVAKSGDNIRAISKDLLGDSGSWKEVWSTNMAVESKSDLAEGTELRYWTDAGTVAAAPAPEVMNEQPAQAEMPAQAANSAPVQDDFALPDDMNDSGAAGSVAAVEPPSPPPPPPPKVEKNVASKDLMADKDMTFILAAGGLLLAGIGIILSIVKKNRARRMSMNTNTQI